MSDDFLGGQTAHKAKTHLYGLYSGVVEYINDPLQLGRMKIRVPEIHGPPEVNDTASLYWSLANTPFGGGNDYGEYMIPPVGSRAWVMFKNGNPRDPVFIGTWNSIPTEPVKMLRDHSKTWPKGPISMSRDADHTWEAPAGPTAPIEALRQVANRPDRYVRLKTPKGATLAVEDRDENENLILLDRSGQGLLMESGVKGDKKENDTFRSNQGNEAKRGQKSVHEGDPLPLASTLVNEGIVTLADIGGQSVTLHTKKDSNRIKIVSRQGRIVNGQIDAGNKETDGANSVSLELGGSDGKLIVEITRNGVASMRLHIDGNLGVVDVETSNSIRLSAPNIDLCGNVAVVGRLTVDKDLYVLGDSLIAGHSMSGDDAIKQSFSNVLLPEL